MISERSLRFGASTLIRPMGVDRSFFDNTKLPSLGDSRVLDKNKNTVAVEALEEKNRE